jgi:serine/threonine protein kinase
MEVIDEGGFGCVIQPPLSCQKGPKPSPSMISKLQPTKYATYEMKQINKVKAVCKKIPNCNNYAVLDVKKCKPALAPNAFKKTKCSLLEEGLTKVSYVDSASKKKKTVKNSAIKKRALSIINMPHMGVNLHRYILNNVDFKRADAFGNINRKIIDLYQNFIMLLNNSRIYHNDIKTLNILVDKSEQYRLIDWGIANHIVFSHRFIFNKPYMYILLSSYFLDKIGEMKKRGPLKKDEVEALIVQYAELIKINKSSDYLYTKEILEFLYPEFKEGHGMQTINPVLRECLVQTAMRFQSAKEWVEIYIHNIDIAGVAIMYPDILCAMGMKHASSTKLHQAILDFYRKYVLECYTKINPAEFIESLKSLNNSQQLSIN